MALRGWKRLALVGLLAPLGFAAGCNERREQEGTVRDEARQVGQATEEAAQEVRETGREAVQGFEEGFGGSGQQNENREGVDIGENPGVINDGEGPLENGQGPLEEGDLQPGQNPGVINDGEGPLEGGE